MTRTERTVLALALLESAGPAFATVTPTPAPVAGAGIGAVLLVAAGYRALKRRIGR